MTDTAGTPLQLRMLEQVISDLDHCSEILRIINDQLRSAPSGNDHDTLTAIADDIYESAGSVSNFVEDVLGVERDGTQS